MSLDLVSVARYDRYVGSAVLVCSWGSPDLLVCFRETESKVVRTLEVNTGTVTSVWERSGRRLVYGRGTASRDSAN